MAIKKSSNYYFKHRSSSFNRLSATNSIYAASRKHTQGYTLLELLISAALIVILLASAAPSFGAAIERSKLRASSLGILESLALARTAAISQNKIVFLCHLNTNQKCEVSNKRNQRWTQGWQVFVDENGNNEFDANDSILSIGKADSSVSIVFNQNGRLRFFPNGSARSAGFYVCGTKLDTTTHLKLLHTGRVRMAKSASKKVKSTCKSTL